MPRPQPLVAITGSSGFVGGHLCTWLLERGYRVRALTRKARLPAPDGLEVIELPNRPEGEDLRAAFDGADAVVHLAGRAHVMRDAEHSALATYRVANVGLTRTALQAAAEAGCRTFLLASSVKAVGERSLTPWTEDTPAAPADPYGQSKLEAEQLVALEGPSLGIRTIILRFPLIYGPGVGANMLRLFRLVDRGVPLPFGAIRNRRSLLFVGNAARAIELGLGAAENKSVLYFVSDGQDLSTPELVRVMAQELGRPARLLSVPPALFRLAGWAGDALAPLIPTALTSSAVQRLLDSLQVNIGRIREQLGFDPPYTVEEGIRLTAAWYRSSAEETA
jgi:UDP-N-acetyl-alpha-D-quinovosamine dehydrogenase